MAKCFDCGHAGAEHETLDGAPVHSVMGCNRRLKAERDELRDEVERLNRARGSYTEDEALSNGGNGRDGSR